MNSSEEHLTQFLASRIWKGLQSIALRDRTPSMTSELICESFDYSQRCWTWKGTAALKPRKTKSNNRGL